MIIRAVSMVALFVDQVAQVPVVVQCVLPPSADPGLKQWIQPILNLVSIVAVVGIAIFSFGATSRKEHRRWVLDQKKAEWSGLLRATAEVQRVLRIVNTPNKERIERIIEELKPAVHELSVASANCVFLQEFFAYPAKREKFYSFIKDADLTSELIGGLREVQIFPNFPPTQQESSDLATRILNETGRITTKYLEFNEWLRKEAAEDLGIASSEKPARQG